MTNVYSSWGIRGKIIGATVIVISVGLLILGWMFSKSFKDFGDIANSSFKDFGIMVNYNFKDFGNLVNSNLEQKFNQFLEKIGSIQSSGLASSCEYYFLAKDKKKLSSICEEAIKNNEHIAYITIEGLEGYKDIIIKKVKDREYDPYYFEDIRNKLNHMQGVQLELKNRTRVLEFPYFLYSQATASTDLGDIPGAESSMMDRAQGQEMSKEQIGVIRVGLNYEVTNAELKKNKEDLDAKFNKTQTDLEAQLNRTQDMLSSKFLRTRSLFIAVGVLLLGLIAIALFIMITSLLSPLAYLVGITQRISKGDLTVNIEVASKDEVGELA
ncbi:MAG: HAMP domain-containing protein, partial [Candidatus Aureabacteria bacterium]|nr:HAMP domain-containing protein [Candidatus Auribacterota bacterium]